MARKMLLKNYCPRTLQKKRFEEQVPEAAKKEAEHVASRKVLVGARGVFRVIKALKIL